MTYSDALWGNASGDFKPLSDVISKLGDVNRSSSLIVLEITVKNRPSPRPLLLVRKKVRSYEHGTKLRKKYEDVTK
jgi:hypothetical protein